MHEASIAEGVLQAALKSMPPQYKRIIRIHLVVGVLSNLEEESLRLYLTELAKGTAAEGAELDWKSDMAAMVCRDCGHADPYDGRGGLEVRCGKCGGPNQLQGGNALYIDNIEVEEE
jgi:hydrogenase nickel incorporation protein HypA/HybF